MSTKEECSEFRRKVARAAIRCVSGNSKKDALCPQALAEELEHSDDAVRKVLRMFQGFRGWWVNPYCTAFHWQYFIDVKLIHSAVAALWKELKEKGHDVGNEPIKALIDYIVGVLDEEYGEHVIVANAYVLHGSGDRDLSLVVYSDDGLASLGEFIRTKVVLTGCADTLTCTEVGWNRAFDGHSGKLLECTDGGEHVENGRRAELTEV